MYCRSSGRNVVCLKRAFVLVYVLKPSIWSYWKVLHATECWNNLRCYQLFYLLVVLFFIKILLHCFICKEALKGRICVCIVLSIIVLFVSCCTFHWKSLFKNIYLKKSIKGLIVWVLTYQLVLNNFSKYNIINNYLKWSIERVDCVSPDSLHQRWSHFSSSDALDTQIWKSAKFKT